MSGPTFAAVLRRRWWLIILVTALGIAAFVLGFGKMAALKRLPESRAALLEMAPLNMTRGSSPLVV